MSELPILPSGKPATQAQPSDATKGMSLFIMIVATLYFGKEVLVPVTLALILAFMLAPVVDLLRRVYLGRVPSVLMAVVLALLIISGIGGIIGSQIGDLSAQIPSYVSTVNTKVNALKKYAFGHIAKLAKNVGGHTDSNGSLTLPTFQPAETQTQTPPPTPIAPPTGPIDFVQRYLTPVLSPLATLGIVFVVAVFALLQREDLRDRLIRLIGSEDLHRTTLAIDEAARRLSRYFVTQLTINSFFGVIMGVGLFAIGIPNPVLWAIISALLRFVPYVGIFIAAILPLGLAAAISPGWTMMLQTGVLYTLIETITGQIIEPLVYGHSTGLSPFSVVVAAIFWSWLWGPIGLILSTPLTLCIVVLGRHIKRLEFLDIILGDRSPLTPVESFYQRVLAGDTDEVLDHAEKLLKERSLSTYYDEVAIKGMQLATHDAMRGALDSGQLERIRNTVHLLIEGLERFTDKQPVDPKREKDEGPLAGSDESRQLPRNPDPQTVPPEELKSGWAAETAVLCIAGRGPLDDLAAAMLAQLLSKHGLNGYVVHHREVSRDQIGSLPVDGVAMACVSYLDISGAPAHLRYLAQRVRDRLPQGTPLLAGIWPAGDKITKDGDARREIGVDYMTNSLAQSVTACVETARNKNR